MSSRVTTPPVFQDELPLSGAVDCLVLDSETTSHFDTGDEKNLADIKRAKLPTSPGPCGVSPLEYRFDVLKHAYILIGFFQLVLKSVVDGANLVHLVFCSLLLWRGGSCPCTNLGVQYGPVPNFITSNVLTTPLRRGHNFSPHLSNRSLEFLDRDVFDLRHTKIRNLSGHSCTLMISLVELLSMLHGCPDTSSLINKPMPRIFGFPNVSPDDIRVVDLKVKSLHSALRPHKVRFKAIHFGLTSCNLNREASGRLQSSRCQNGALQVCLLTDHDKG